VVAALVAVALLVACESDRPKVHGVDITPETQEMSDVYLYPQGCPGPTRTFYGFESLKALRANANGAAFDVHCGTKGTLIGRTGDVAEVEIDETLLSPTHVWVPYSFVHLERHPKAPPGVVEAIAEREFKELLDGGTAPATKKKHKKHRKKHGGGGCAVRCNDGTCSPSCSSTHSG